MSEQKRQFTPEDLLRKIDAWLALAPKQVKPTDALPNLLTRAEWQKIKGLLSGAVPREYVDRGDAVNLVFDLGEYGDNALAKITMHGLRCLFDAIERMDAALKEVPSEKGGSTADKRDAARWRFLEHGCQWVGFGFTPTGGADRLEPNTEGFRYVLMWMDHLIERQLDADQSYLLEWRQFVSDCQTLLASPARGEVSEEMVERALDAAKGRMVDTRRFWTDDDRVAVRAMLEAANEII